MMQTMQTSLTTLSAENVALRNTQGAIAAAVVEDPAVVAQRRENEQLMARLEAARAARANENPEMVALRLEKAELSRQLAEFGGGAIPMVVGGDDNDSVHSELSDASFASVTSRTDIQFTGQVAKISRKGWHLVCTRPGSDILHLYREGGKLSKITIPQYQTLKRNNGECIEP
jgi:hypothetical protein